MKRTNMKRTSLQLSLLAGAAAAMILAACGGGSGSSASVSIPSPGTSTSSGTITGFGSVIVDGVRIDDHAVVAGTEQEDGSVINTELKIGQHVDVQHDASLLATMIRVTPELKGAVDKVDTTAGTLSVLGQVVVINTVANTGPVTVFEAPYTQLSDIKSGDMIEVHGLLKTDAAGKVTLQATRIEKKTVGAFNRVKGNVSELSTSASTFKVGTLLVSYAGATLKPSASALANGAEVYVSIPVTPTFTGSAVNAAVIKIKNRHAENQDKDTELGGAITKLDAATKTFIVDGVKVDASQARFDQSGKAFADLSEGVYVRIKGIYLADGTLKASSVVLRGLERESGREIELHGSILSFKSNADFMLRGLGVDASTAKISCSGVSALADNLQVEVQGHLTAAGKVIAVEIKCENTQQGQSTVEREGLVASVDLTAKTLTIGSLSNTVSVQWNANTLFVDIETAGLNGKKIEVEGTLTGNVFVATKIKLVRS